MRIMTATAGAAAALACALQAHSAPARGRPAPPAGTPTPAGAVAEGMSTAGGAPSQRLAAAMSQIHLTVCAQTIHQAAEFLFEGQPANFTLQPLGPDPDRWPVVVTMESAHPTLGRTRLSTIIAAPGPTCAGMYEQTIYWAQPCAELKRTTFAAFQSAHVLLRDVQVSEANAALQLYLMPGGPGCVSVKKELFH